MAAAIGKYAANKMLHGEMKKYTDRKAKDPYDPYFAWIDVSKPGSKKPKMKKVKKQVPAYVPEHDATILAKMRKRSYNLDMKYGSIAGVKLGYSSVLALIPIFGDFADAALALLLVLQCCRVTGGLPNSYKSRMMTNVIIDLVIGFVPFIGDIADGVFTANTRNVRILEEYLDSKYKPQEVVNHEKRESARPDKRYSRPPPATAFEDYEDEQQERNDFVAEQRRQDTVNQPPPQAAATSQGGWFSKIRGGQRQPDVEMAQATPVQPARPAATYHQETGTISNGR